MDDIEIFFQKSQSPCHTACYSGKDIFRDARSLQFVQRSSVHILHTVVNARFYKKSAVEFNNLGCDGAMKDVELHNDGTEFGVLKFQPYFLKKRIVKRGEQGK